MASTTDQAILPDSAGLHRAIGWKDAFWMASGVPALVLFSIGGIAATVGNPSWVIWILSVSFGFLQAFVYAEIAGLFPSKSGGASVYGAAAWIRYSKIVAPLSVWCNWLAWTPVLAIGGGLAAGYLLTALVPEGAAILDFRITLINLDFLKDDLSLRIDAVSIIGTIILLIVFAIQHKGISAAAKVQTILGLAVLIPLLIVGIVPLVSGNVMAENLTPVVPGLDPVTRAWDIEGTTLFLGGLFIAAWSAYAFETAICYTSEFRDPSRDTVRAILAAGAACILIYTLVPLAFQGFLGVDGLLQPGVEDGSAIAKVMATMVGGDNVFIVRLITVMLFFALTLAIMTSMAGSSRTLFQGSVDGWLPKFLSHANEHGAPTRAMWTDLAFNLVLLMMSDYLFVLAVSNCCYLVFNFLNLHSGWIHRIDNKNAHRPWRAPTVMLWIGGGLSFINAALLGAGSNVWGKGTLMTAVVVIALILPVFFYRHYVTDKGKFPEKMLDDLKIGGNPDLSVRKAGIRPYLVIAAGIAVVVISNMIFKI
ncbi:APC family permease [Pontibaca methylaminivorans]|uniref:Amino acid/polyamine/organocation transporter, APC superfamily n=1 Tax=Pontibaca methylaminivorans TaxID=515897 RepID=A0A1R3X8N0_9RHOB|nr:APC family permease [Pontibaca methylaminivorans]SIT87100.1 amino acid/polyamine/organocation transporter, APC superfamily [Pontibaca methylaminivorans]